MSANPLPEVSVQLMTLVQRHLANRPDALQFLKDYCVFCHAIDDIIDIPERRADNEFFGRVLHMALNIFSCDFYANRRQQLRAIVSNIHNAYFDSVIMERSNLLWMKTTGDVLRCSAHDMTAAVVEIVVAEETGSLEAGYDAKREVSMLCRENSWACHHDEKGNPV